MATRQVSASDIYQFQIVSDAAISPTGLHVIYVQQHIDKTTEAKHSNLWLATTSGGRPRQFTYGDQNDHSPCWSPDGSTIAFLSNRGAEKKTQIYVIPVDGGEARKLTSMDGSFAQLLWSADGRDLLCLFRAADPGDPKKRKDPQEQKLGTLARHFTDLKLRAEGVGFLSGERWHIWRVNSRTGRSRLLTEGHDFDHADLAVSADGKQIAFCANRSEDPDLEPLAIDLCIMDAESGSLSQIDAPAGPKSKPSFSADGTRIAFYATAETRKFWLNTDLWLASTDNSVAARNLTGTSDINTGIATIGDCNAFPNHVAPIWSADDRQLFFHQSHHGATSVVVLDLDDAEAKAEPVLFGPQSIGSLSADSACETLAYVASTQNELTELWVHSIYAGSARQLSRKNRDLLRRRRLGRIEEHWFDNRDGTRVQGWIMTPPDFDPMQSYPAILEIHGGPMVQYGHAFMHEFHFLAAEGYVIFFCNPRGSTGYGNQFVDDLVGDFAARTFEDLMVWTDIVAALPYVDENRIGVTGGSFGGYMTNWIIGHTDRFAAAVTQRSLCNLVSFHGTADFNWLFQMWQGDLPPWDVHDQYWRQSPLKYVRNVKTPTLVMHSLGDLRVPYEQGEQMYIALKQMGVESELVLFPEENHGLSRSGRTDRRIARLEHMLRWFDRFLKS